MKLRFKCIIDVNNREQLPSILYDLIKEIENTEEYPNEKIYETFAWKSFKSTWSIQTRNSLNKGGEK